MNNSIGARAELTIEFKDRLERRTGVPVTLWDERLTTVAAEKASGALVARNISRVSGHNIPHDLVYRVVSLLGQRLIYRC